MNESNRRSPINTNANTSTKIEPTKQDASLGEVRIKYTDCAKASISDNI